MEFEAPGGGLRVGVERLIKGVVRLVRHLQYSTLQRAVLRGSPEGPLEEELPVEFSDGRFEGPLEEWNPAIRKSKKLTLLLTWKLDSASA